MAKGSIERRGENSWRLTVELGVLSDGTRDRERKTIRVEDKALLRTTKRLQDHLELELAKFQMEVEAGTYIKPEKITLKEFLDQHWWPKYAKAKGGLAGSTQKTYMDHIDSRILPRFGHMRLDEIKTMHMVDFMNELQGPNARLDGKLGPLESGTIRYIHRILRNIFSRAVEWKFIPEDGNPMDGVKRPPKPDTKIEVYDEDEMQEIVNALYDEAPTWRLLILGTFLGGFRRGEVVALELDDLNFETDCITIDENIPMKIKGEYLIGPTKNRKTRVVKMPHWYMEELSEYCLEWKKEKLRIGDKWEGGDRRFLFHSGKGKPYHPNYPTTWWRNFIEKNGFRYIKLHGLRHSSATYLLEKGATLESIQERLGHTSKQSTDIYLHVTSKMEKKVVSEFDQFQRYPIVK